MFVDLIVLSICLLDLLLLNGVVFVIIACFVVDC